MGNRVSVGVVVASVWVMWLGGVSSQARSIDQPAAGGLVERRICAAVDGVMPVNVQVDPRMLSLTQLMLRRSDEFRRQCEELARRPTVYVRVGVPLFDLPNQFCARSLILRTAAGPLLAFVEVGIRVNWSEWLAHEFEHVLEQAEGLRVADLDRGRAGWQSAESVYETARAIDAGRAVREQMRRKPPASALTDE